MTLGKHGFPAVSLGVCVCAVLVAGCLSKVTVLQSPDAGAAPGAGSAGTSPGGPPIAIDNGSGSSDSQWYPQPPVAPENCVNGGACRFVDAQVIDKLDLLFVVDNTAGMADAQEKLAAQLPQLITSLTTGQHFPGDPDPFTPIRDLHVGVVSSDLGTPGIHGVAGCDADGDDDGRMQDTPHGDNCDEHYPRFLTYSSMLGTSPQKFADDLGCVARLGTQGCTYRQPLEAALKALWPSVFVDTQGNVVTPNPISFLATTPMGTLGRGDLPAAQGGNIGFLRNDPQSGLSVVAIIVVTDGDDCSARNSEIFKPQDQLLPDSPYYSQSTDLRCYYNKALLYDIVNRYSLGFRLLRQGHEPMVIFGAIAGVPPELVGPVARAGVDFSDAAERNAYYARLLADSRMQEQIDPAAGDKQRPSCVRMNSQQQVSKALPPRRLVELARAMGDQGVIQSICDDEFDMRPFIDAISQPMGGDCLSDALQRSAKNVVACDVIWELPAANQAPVSTPTMCSQAGGFLKRVAAPHKATNDRGGQNCIVTQLPVLDSAVQADVPPGEGWYYDTFTRELPVACRQQTPQRIAFTAGAKPPTGVRVVLDCKAAAYAPRP